MTWRLRISGLWRQGISGGLQKGSRSFFHHSFAVAFAAILTLVAAVVAIQYYVADPTQSRAASIAAACLVLWLFEIIPAYVTTLIMLVAIPLAMNSLDPKAYSLPSVLRGAANPVLVLFFAGMTLSVAATRYRIDAWIANHLIHLSRGRRRLLLAAVMLGTAVLSMWMSNIAAGAMMIATLKPMVGSQQENRSFLKALLLGVAFAADFGGIGTPIGTGPNLIAIAAVQPGHSIDFLEWMRFGIPIAITMVAFSYGLLVWGYNVRGEMPAGEQSREKLAGSGWCVVAIFFASVIAWMLEPLHHIPAAVVGLIAAIVLFATNLLDARDLGKIDWPTLLLIAGGLILGDLFEKSGLVRSTATAFELHRLPQFAVVAFLIIACAVISAVASNTAAAAVLIQIGMGIMPTPAMAVLIALAASMGVPFAISTPPNAIAYGQGYLRTRDLMIPGLCLMLIGCGLLAVVGLKFLHWSGVP